MQEQGFSPPVSASDQRSDFYSMTETERKLEQDGAFSLLLRGRKAYSIAQEIDAALGLDDNFPATKNLALELIQLLRLLEITKRQQEWIEALEALNAAEDKSEKKRWVLIAPSGRGGNPLGGRIGDYPLPSFLLQTEPTVLGSHGRVLKYLFLSAVLVNPKHLRIKSANLLRKALEVSASDQHKLIREMPVVGTQDYRGAMGAFFHEFESSDLPERGTVLLRALQELYDEWVCGSSVPVQRHFDRRGWPAALTQGTTRSDLDTPAEGHLSLQLLTPAEPSTGEQPEYLDIFVAQAEEDGLPPSEQEIDDSARESRYWIRRQQRLVPGDSGRFTPIERRRVARLLNQWLLSEDIDERIGAGFIALMYVTGRDLDSVLKFRFGPEGTFDLNGSYRRTIRQPIGAFTPDDRALAAMEPYAENLLLRLPLAICNWLLKHCKPTHETLLNSLEIDQLRARKAIDALMNNLRDRGRFQRIRLDRISAALPLELTLAFRDPAVTFMLAGQDEHVAPMLSYYAVYESEDLINRFSIITERMLSIA